DQVAVRRRARTRDRLADLHSRRRDRRPVSRSVVVAMPPRGVKKGTKRARQYEHIKQSERASGVSERRAEEIAARTVNKERARSGEARSSSRLSRTDISSGRRGGLRSGTKRPRGPHVQT